MMILGILLKTHPEAIIKIIDKITIVKSSRSTELEYIFEAKKNPAKELRILPTIIPGLVKINKL